MGLTLFILAKILIAIVYPFGFTYSVLLTFFKSFVSAFKYYISNQSSQQIYSPKLLLWVKWFFLSLLKAFIITDAYFFNCAIADDQHANAYLAKFFNDTMVKPSGPKFGNPDETLSSVYGKGYASGKLRLLGTGIDKILERLDEGHSEKAIEHDES